MFGGARGGGWRGEGIGPQGFGAFGCTALRLWRLRIFGFGGPRGRKLRERHRGGLGVSPVSKARSGSPSNSKSPFLRHDNLK